MLANKKKFDALIAGERRPIDDGRASNEDAGTDRLVSFHKRPFYTPTEMESERDRTFEQLHTVWRCQFAFFSPSEDPRGPDAVELDSERSDKWAFTCLNGAEMLCQKNSNSRWRILVLLDFSAIEPLFRKDLN